MRVRFRVTLLTDAELPQGQKTVNINDITFKARELNGEIVGDRMIFTLTAGKYTLK